MYTSLMYSYLTYLHTITYFLILLLSLLFVVAVVVVVTIGNLLILVFI